MPRARYLLRSDRNGARIELGARVHTDVEKALVRFTTPDVQGFTLILERDELAALIRKMDSLTTQETDPCPPSSSSQPTPSTCPHA